MSLLLNYSLTEATALIRGDMALLNRPAGFEVDGLSTFRLSGIEPAAGHAPLDADAAWQSVVRAWWGIGATWGLCVTGDDDEQVHWNLLMPERLSSAKDAVPAHLTGAQLVADGSFSQLAGRLRKLPFTAAMAGHPGVGSVARVEPAVRAMLGHEFMFLVLAKPMPRPEIESELRRLAREQQFVRDEHLARPGLEQDNHSAAGRYLALIEAATERATAAMQEGGWQTRVLLAAASEADFRRAQSLIHSAYAGEGGMPEPLRWQETADQRALTLLRTAEVAALTRPPQRELPGFQIEVRHQQIGASADSTSAALFSTTAPNEASVQSIALGRILDDAGQPRAWLEIPTRDLCRHLLVAGMTGSGKTVTCEHILLELWREHRIPWLVIEPGIKTGYRRLLNSEIGNDLQVWSLGLPQSRRLGMNPLAAPPGLGLAEHTSGLFSVLASAFELVPPMPEVLATAIEQTYRNHGWNLSDIIPIGPAPRLSDLLAEIDRSTRELGYNAEIAGNIRAGLLLRLKRLAFGPLAPELTASAGLDVASLVARPTVIELSALPDAETQALVLGFISLQLRHHWRLSGETDSLRHVTLIEEAHRLLRAVPETAANATRTRAVEDIANMLAELRAMGAGMIIVDQTPSALVPSVIANTGTKIIHRLDHPADRELAGGAAGLPSHHLGILGALKAGDAIVRSDQRPRPFRARIPNPSVTYASMPTPKLPRVERGPEPNRAGRPCEVCGRERCLDAAEGARQQLLESRLSALQTALNEGEDAAWEWARRELSALADTGNSDAPLCFLIALGRAAKLSESTLHRLSAAFEPRTHPRT